MSETLSPTRERLRKSAFDAPKTDRTTDRKAYRVLSIVGELLSRGDIEPEHLQAAEKFKRHRLGAAGVDVRHDFGGSGEEFPEYPRSYHAQKIAEVEAALTPREFQILERITADEATPVSIGFGLSGYARADAARPFGVAAINFTLDHLAWFWGLKRREPPSSR